MHAPLLEADSGSMEELYEAALLGLTFGRKIGLHQEAKDWFQEHGRHLPNKPDPANGRMIATPCSGFWRGIQAMVSP